MEGTVSQWGGGIGGVLYIVYCITQPNTFPGSPQAYNSIFYSSKSSDTRVILVKAVQTPLNYLTLLSSTLIYMSMKKITNKNAVLSTDCLFNIETHA